MKKEYETPTIEIVIFNNENTLSGLDTSAIGDYWNNGEGFTKKGNNDA